MERRTLIILGLAGLVIGLLAYSFWPSKKNEDQIGAMPYFNNGSQGKYVSSLGLKNGDNPSIISYANSSSGDKIRGSYKIVDGQKTFVPSSVNIDSINAKGETDTAYIFASGQKVEFNTYEEIVVKNKSKPLQFDFPADPDKIAKKQDATGSFAPFSFGGIGGVASSGSSNECLAVLSYIQNDWSRQKNLEFQLLFTEILSQMNRVDSFGYLSTQGKADMINSIIQDLQSNGKINIDNICSSLVEKRSQGVDNQLFKQCVLVMQKIMNEKNTDRDFILSSLQKGIDGFTLIPSSQQLSIATQISSSLYNYTKDPNIGFDINYYCNMIASLISGILTNTDVFKQCVVILKAIETQYNSNKSLVSKDFIMNKLMEISGFAFVSFDKRTYLVGLVYEDLTDDGKLNYDNLCIAITAAIYDAITGTDLFKQCIAIMSDIQTIPNPTIGDIDDRLSTLNGFSLLSSSKKQNLILAIQTDLNDGGDFNANLHCFNIVAAILDAIGSSDLFKQCLTIMDTVQSEYNKRSSSGSLNVDDFKNNFILQQLLQIDSFILLSQEVKQKQIDDIYTDLTNGGDFNKHLICTNIVLAIAAVVTSSPLYQQCLTIMDEIVASGKKDYSFIQTQLAKLTGFLILSTEQQNDFVNKIISDLNDGGEFAKEQHCFSIVAAILDAIANSALYKKCIAIMDEVQSYFEKTSFSNQDKYSFISNKLSSGLTGFSALPDTKKDQLINDVISDYNDDNKIDAQQRCLDIVLAILENKITDTTQQSCKSVTLSIINSNSYTNKDANATKLLPFFDSSQDKSSKKAELLALYDPSSDKEKYAEGFCSSSNVLDPTSSTTCVGVVEELTAEKQSISQMVDKVGYVNGVLSLKINGYSYNEGLIGSVLDYVLNSKGTSSNICSPQNITNNDSITEVNTQNNNNSSSNSSSNNSNTDEATTSTCITEVDALLGLSSTPAREYVLASLKSVEPVASMDAAVISGRVDMVMSKFNGIAILSSDICANISSNSASSLSADDINEVTEEDVESACKNIIYQVSNQITKYQVDAAKIPSTDPAVIETQEGLLKSTYISNVMSEVDQSDHLAPQTASGYIKSLLEVHLTGLGANYSSKEINVLNQETKARFTQLLHDNIDMVKALGGNAQKFFVTELGKCINPLRTERDIQNLVSTINIKENGLSLRTTMDIGSDNYSIIIQSRKSNYYSQCLSVVNNSTNSQNIDVISDVLQSSVNGVAQLGNGIADKIANRILCYKQICPSIGAEPLSTTSQCSSESFTCADDADKMNICDELASTIYINVSNADVVGASYEDLAICEPKDIEYINHMSILLNQNQDDYLTKINDMSSAILEKSKTTSQGELNLFNNQIAFNYILSNSIFNNIYTDNVNYGLLKFNDISSTFNDNRYSYSQFNNKYYELIGLLDSSGVIITQSELLKNSTIFTTCTAFLNNVFYNAYYSNKQTDNTYINNAIKSLLKQKNAGITGFSVFSSTEQAGYIGQFASYIINSAENSSALFNFVDENPCKSIAVDIFNKSSANNSISGSFIVKNSNTGNTSTINVGNVDSLINSISSYITSDAKKDLMSPNLELSDIDFTKITNTNIVNDETNAEKNRFILTKTSDFINAGLSRFTDQDLSIMSYDVKKSSIASSQLKIYQESVIGMEMFDLEGKQRLCKTVLDVWNATLKNNGNAITVEQCASILVNNWSDSACTVSNSANDFTSVCGSIGPGLRKVSTGEICFDTSAQSGLDVLDSKAKEKEAKRSYYDRLLNPPTNKCKCYVEKIYRLLDGIEIPSFEVCSSNEDSYINKVQQIFYGGGDYSYGQSVINSPRNYSCKMVYSQVSEILNDNTETSKLQALFTSNEDYKAFAKQICIQRLRDLYSTIEYVRKAYWMNTNIRVSDGTVLKESEFTKWQNSTLEQCDAELEDYT